MQKNKVILVFLAIVIILVVGFFVKKDPSVNGDQSANASLAMYLKKFKKLDYPKYFKKLPNGAYFSKLFEHGLATASNPCPASPTPSASVIVSPTSPSGQFYTYGTNRVHLADITITTVVNCAVYFDTLGMMPMYLGNAEQQNPPPLPPKPPVLSHFKLFHVPINWAACAGTGCPIQPGGVTEACADGIDNDGDGYIDGYGRENLTLDVNHNGLYDAGDTFIDTNGNGIWDVGPAETFTDTNANGIYDLGEPYTDTNTNGQWDHGDLQCYMDSDYDGIYDMNGEPYVDNNTANGKYDPPEPFSDLNSNLVWDVGEPFTDFNSNGVQDVGETYTDTNANGHYDGNEYNGALNLEQGSNDQFTDTNANGVWDAGEPFVEDTNGYYDPGETYTDTNVNGMYDYGEPFTDADGIFQQAGKASWGVFFQMFFPSSTTPYYILGAGTTNTFAIYADVRTVDPPPTWGWNQDVQMWFQNGGIGLKDVTCYPTSPLPYESCPFLEVDMPNGPLHTPFNTFRQ